MLKKHDLLISLEPTKTIGRILGGSWGLSGANVCKSCSLVDIGKSFPTTIYLQNRRRYSRERTHRSLGENSIHYSFASLVVTEMGPALAPGPCRPDPRRWWAGDRFLKYKPHTTTTIPASLARGNSLPMAPKRNSQPSSGQPQSKASEEVTHGRKSTTRWKWWISYSWLILLV